MCSGGSRLGCGLGHCLATTKYLTFSALSKKGGGTTTGSRGGGGTLGISGWGCATGTLEPLTYTRASSAEFCYPILE